MSSAENIKLLWNKISLVQKALLVGIVFACLITGFVLTKWATQPNMGILFGGLDPEDAAKIVDKVQERGVEYELGAGGTSIYVDREKIHEVRLAMAKEGLPRGGQQGWSLFDDAKIGESPLAQDVKHLQALQEEIAMTIQMIDGIRYARVHLVLPEKTLFSTGPNEAKASVTINMIGARRLSTANIAAITHIVAGSIEGLPAANVRIIDNTGKLLSNMDDGNGTGAGAGTYLDYKEKVQKLLEKKVQDMLERVLGPGKSTITVCAEIDMTSIEIQQTTIEGKGTPVEEKSSTNKKTQTEASEETTGAQNEEKNEESETKYVIPQKITKTSKMPGQITSISVSAMVDLSIAKPIDETAEATAENQTSQPEMIMSVEQVKDIIRNAIGRDILKDDALTVINVPFARPEPVYQETSSAFSMPQIMKYIKQSSIGIMAICALLVFKIFSSGKGTAPAETDEAALAAGVQPQAAALSSDTNILRKQIAGALKSNPDQARLIFSSWIQEG